MLTRAGGTDITRRLGDLTAGTAFRLERDEPGILRVRLPWGRVEDTQ